MSLESKVILITGASSGIGRSAATYLAGKGYSVFGASRKRPAGDYNFEWVAMDVTDEKSISEAMAEVWAKKQRLDVVVNNAGLGIVGPLEETPDSLIERVLQTNFLGVLRVCRMALPYLRRRGGGMIINVSSIAGAMGLPYRGIYSASKAAVIALTESLSMELKGQRILVCTVLPGDIATPINTNRLVVPLRADSVYRPTFDRIQAQINHEVDSASDPIVVAKLIERIMETRHPRMHYSVGPFLQKFSVWLKIFLPGRLFEWILMKFYSV